MNISQLLEALKDSSVVLTVGQKLTAGLSVALLSMSVVFIVLAIIAAIIALLQKEKVKTNSIDGSLDNIKSIDLEEEIDDTQDMGELVSAITAAILADTGNSTKNILVKKIVRTNNSKSSWESMQKNITR